MSDTCDFQFSLFGAASGGSQVGSTLTKSDVSVDVGLFNVSLDFGANSFAGDARWLAIDRRCPAGSGSFTALLPRQSLTATPYALYAPANWSLTGNVGTTAGTTDAIAAATTANAARG